MKIELNNTDKTSLNKLLEVLDTNISVSEIYTYYLTNLPTSINKGRIDEYSPSPIEECFYNSLLDVLGLNKHNMENYCYYNKFNNIHKLNPNEYLNNPYYKNIKVAPDKKAKWQFRYLKYEPYQGFAYKDVSWDQNNYYAEITSLGFFDEPFKYLAVIQNDDIWMSITPHEIETMKESINEATGEVVVFGLGLGYYPYMISLKKDVKHITIVEMDDNVIELFKKDILTQFKYKDKISIVKANAYEYIKDMPYYDYAFVDLWHNEIDGLPFYCTFKKYEKNYPITKFSYWIENSLLTMIRRCLITLIDETVKGSSEKDYQEEKNYFDHLINKLYYIYKDTSINTYKDIITLLSKENLLKIVGLIEK